MKTCSKYPNRIMSSRKSPVVNKTIEILYQAKKKKSSIVWTVVNGILFLIFSYDLSCQCPGPLTIYHYAEYLLASVFALNFIYHVAQYLYLSCIFTPVEVTPSQMKLLGIQDNDSSFKVHSPKQSQPSTPVADSTEVLDLSSTSWLSNSSSGHQSVTSNSWMFQRGSTSPEHEKSTTLWPKKDDFISDSASLQEYLREYEEKEALSNLSTNSIDEGWSPHSDTCIRTPSAYQCATLDSSGSKSPTDESSPPTSSQVWCSLQIDPEELTQWNLNLRLWISKTILERLVKEINHIDESLQRAGMSDVKVGMVGLDRLRRTAAVASHIPTLATLITFLEISNNQEYIVQRIKELAAGGCMSAYKWNKGGRYHDQDWHEGLPTDAALVMHLIAKYLDTQLLPVRAGPERAAFSSEHYRAHGDTSLHGNREPTIVHARLHPPHFMLMYNSNTIQLDKGRNNMFHTFLLFLKIISSKHHGMLGRVNLGSSGLNLLWVIGR